MCNSAWGESGSTTPQYHGTTVRLPHRKETIENQGWKWFWFQWSTKSKTAVFWNVAIAESWALWVSNDYKTFVVGSMTQGSRFLCFKCSKHVGLNKILIPMFTLHIKRWMSLRILTFVFLCISCAHWAKFNHQFHKNLLREARMEIH